MRISSAAFIQHTTSTTVRHWVSYINFYTHAPSHPRSLHMHVRSVVYVDYPPGGGSSVVGHQSVYGLKVGSVNTNTGDEAKYVWYLHVMLISFSFIVSIILLNLLISIMSDTYANAKKRAEMEWRKFILRDMLEDVSTNTPKYFFKYGRLGPMWIPLIDSWMEEYGHKLHKDWFREARNADIKNVKMQVSDVKKQVSDMREQISDIKEQMVSLQQDIGRLTSALLANSKGGVGLLLEDDEPTGAGGNTGGGGK
ncbi:hypothetical protein Vafri_18866 [Volvox africanus]|uniref:Ion transport domain-containing protein n=1 Tax=Volvox africanus TaxID=51714 RepID=A0A8J4BTH6_9CHLO|nr:hypothetical protein Vafri_18866 [Volvox africanus]